MSRFAELPRRALSGARVAFRGAATTTWTAASIAHAELRSRVAQAEQVNDLDDLGIRRWARGTLAINGIQTLVADPLPPPPQGVARLVVCNHRSALDIPILLAHFGGSMLSRHDVADWPVVGRGAKRANCIFVDRDNPQSGATAIRAIRNRLEAGATVNVFPEGTTFAGDEIREFSRGALVAARGLSVQVLPVALAYPSGTEFVEDDFADHVRNFASRPRIRVGVAIGRLRKNDASPRELITSLHDEMKELVKRARQIRGA